MRLATLLLSGLVSLLPLSSSTILQNGQLRETHFQETKIASVTSTSTGWRTYEPNAPEISYKGRWDSKHISWWAAPGIKFGFTGQNVALTFGEHTSPLVLVAYRFGGLDWQMTNITANATHQFISPSTRGLNLTLSPQLPQIFELRVTNWGLGVQVRAVHVSSNSTLIKIPNFSKSIEFIGDSLTSGMYATYEAFSGFGYNIGAGFGDVEFSITAYPGICLTDAVCWDNPRGQTYQWFHTQDTSPRAAKIYGTEPEEWDFSAHPSADLVIINLGTNDNNTHNNLTSAQYLTSYLSFVSKVQKVHPNAQIILMSLWKSFSAVGNSYRQTGAFVDEIYQVYQHYKDEGYVHYFNSTGVLQHNDYGPGSHPTDWGHIKVASHMMQYIRLKFGWEFGASGPEIQHETLYWNNEPNY
ncbi:acetylxylan esterase [Clohesyomyces aquaticus]|uniref:Acetylxylan esterase n=1 Tax=Clohesyomyces aquaticus TaxID=1231657 RepID=A0A1Y2A8R3_9PLEO|nr:acetylxylan esterase [Clohesyomyces aquaticus]